MDKKNEKAIMGVFKQFESRRGGKTCKSGAPCAFSLLAQMGLSPCLASELLHLFHDIGNCCWDGRCDLPLEANLGVDPFVFDFWPEAERREGQLVGEN